MRFKFVVTILFAAFIWCTPSDAAKESAVDSDRDGLTDTLEARFGTDNSISDSDGDGYPDGLEVASGYSPTSPLPKKLPKRIEVMLKEQKLRFYLGDVNLGIMVVSTGKWNLPTPKGSFRILNKSPRAWSKKYGLWMPYWMGFAYGGKYGIHELPEWPNGYKEGANHLGKPVSHGCIRLGVGDAKKLYSWAETGTPVIIK